MKYLLNLIQGKWREIQKEVPTDTDSGKMEEKWRRLGLRTKADWGYALSTFRGQRAREARLTGITHRGKGARSAPVQRRVGRA